MPRVARVLSLWSVAVPGIASRGRLGGPGGSWVVESVTAAIVPSRCCTAELRVGSGLGLAISEAQIRCF